MKVLFSIPVKAIPKRYQLFLTHCKEEGHGPGRTQCDCGQNFAAWFKTPGPEYTAYTDVVKQLARDAMKKAGILTPMPGPVELQIIIFVERPKSHFIGSDKTRGLKPQFEEDLPGSPNPIACLDAMQHILSGTVYHDRRQVSYPSAPKLYGDRDSVQIMVQQLRASMIDPRNKQLELF